MGIESEKKNGFDAVYEEYHKMVFRIAYHYICNREEAEDISQVVFGRLLHFFRNRSCDKRTELAGDDSQERCGESRKTYKL